MAKPDPVDPATLDRLQVILARARTRGIDPIESLNRYGFLLTPAQEKRIKIETMGWLLDQMTNWSVAQFLRRDPYLNLNAATPQDLYISMVQWLEDQIQRAKEGI